MEGGIVRKLRERLTLRRLYPIMILHLYSLSHTQASPNQVIEMMADSKQTLQNLSKTFRKMAALVKKWNYTLHRAAYLTSLTIPEKRVREFLQRLSHSLNMGINLEGFMKIEYEKFLSTSEAEFERALEKVKKYIEAYSALLTSMAFLSVSMLLTSMIYGVDVAGTLTATALTLTLSLATLTLLIARAIPRDPVIHDAPWKPEALAALQRINLPLTLLSHAASITVYASTLGAPDSGNPLIDALTPIPIALAAAGIPLMFVGRLGRRWVRKAEEMDEHYPTFIKSLGDAIQVSGSLKSASKILMMNDYGPLNKLLKRLHKRIEAGFPQQRALERFGAESLSSHILGMSRLLADNLNFGSKASACAKAIHDYSLKHLLSRKKRRQVAGTLKGIAIPLQATLAAISALISILAKILSRFASLISPWMPIITPIPETQLTGFILTVIMASSIVSATAIYLVEGDSQFTLTHSLGLLLTLSAAAYYASASASQTLFSIFTKFEEGVTGLLEEV